jgi:hypothetical protein
VLRGPKSEIELVWKDVFVPSSHYLCLLAYLFCLCVCLSVYLSACHDLTGSRKTRYRAVVSAIINIRLQENGEFIEHLGRF